MNSNLKINNINYKLIICNNFFNRLTGLMFKKNIDFCLLFPRCNSIHTFFMMENINVIMTNKNNKILYIFKEVKPWRIILPKKNVYNTYELPKNTIINLKIGDYLK